MEWCCSARVWFVCLCGQWRRWRASLVISSTRSSSSVTTSPLDCRGMSPTTRTPSLSVDIASSGVSSSSLIQYRWTAPRSPRSCPRYVRTIPPLSAGPPTVVSPWWSQIRPDSRVSVNERVTREKSNGLKTWFYGTPGHCTNTPMVVID